MNQLPKSLVSVQAASTSAASLHNDISTLGIQYKTLNRWSGIPIYMYISGLIRIRIQMSARSLPKFCGFELCVVTHSSVAHSSDTRSVCAEQDHTAVQYSATKKHKRSTTCQCQSFRRVVKIDRDCMRNSCLFRNGERSERGSPPKVNQFLRLVGPIIASSFCKIGWLLLQ